MPAGLTPVLLLRARAAAAALEPRRNWYHSHLAHGAHLDLSDPHTRLIVICSIVGAVVGTLFFCGLFIWLGEGQ
jgi:hypothetical protein